jgi:aminoglycoside phosphotransferase (APT) family kinase protein
MNSAAQASNAGVKSQENSATPPVRTLGLPTAKPRRELGEAKDLMETWLRSRLPERSSLRLTDLRTPQGSGICNETLIADAAWEQGGVTLTGGYVARIETPDGLYPATEFANQYRMNEALAGAPGVPVPSVVGFESDRSIMGNAFYVMEMVRGRAPPDSPPFHAEGWVYDLAPDRRARMWRDAVATMARIHAVDVGKLQFLQRPSRGQSGFDQEFDYYCDYRDWAIFGERHPILDAALDWLRSHRPVETPTGLSWGDARVANMLFEDEQVTAVLDWDMVSLAGAEADLAWWAVTDQNATFACGLPRLPGFGTPRATIQLWESLSGRKVRDFEFHLVFAAFRNAILVVRLARSLDRLGRLPPESKYLLNNNRGIQYLTTMLDLPNVGPVTIPWPGLDR